MLLLGTLALVVGSLATVAVPKLAGELIDVCINYAKEESSGDVAKRVLNQKLFQIIGILAVGGVATGIRSWCVTTYLLSTQRSVLGPDRFCRITALQLVMHGSHGMLLAPTDVPCVVQAVQCQRGEGDVAAAEQSLLSHNSTGGGIF